MEILYYVIIPLTVLLVVIPLIGARLLMRRFLRRYDMDKYALSLRVSDMTGRYEPRIVHFRSKGNVLCGYVFGEDTKGGLVIFCHGLFGGAEEYFAFARHFVDTGRAVFMFDNTGCNRSTGESIKGPLQGLRDLRCAMRYLSENEPSLYSRKKALIGHSWGGFTAAAYRRTDDIDCVVSLAGFDRSAPAICDFMVGLYGRKMKILMPYVYLFLLMQYGRDFGTSAVSVINSSRKPYLIIQGTNDKIIHADGASLYNRRAKVTNPRVTFILRDDALHNKHNTIYRDADATACMESIYAMYRQARAITDEKRRDDRLQEIYSSVDRFAVNTLDKEFTDTVDAFLSRYID